MGLARFMLKLYNWKSLSDQSLFEMKERVDSGIMTALELSMGDGFPARSSRKDLDALYKAQSEIEAEMRRRCGMGV